MFKLSSAYLCESVKMIR